MVPVPDTSPAMTRVRRTQEGEGVVLTVGGALDSDTGAVLVAAVLAAGGHVRSDVLVARTPAVVHRHLLGQPGRHPRVPHGTVTVSQAQSMEWTR